MLYLNGIILLCALNLNILHFKQTINLSFYKALIFFKRGKNTPHLGKKEKKDISCYVETHIIHSGLGGDQSLRQKKLLRMNAALGREHAEHNEH